MAVIPGKQGSGFIDPSEKIKWFKHHWPNKEIRIDGAMNRENSALVRKAGADVIISGSFYGRSKNPEKTIKELKGEE